MPIQPGMMLLTVTPVMSFSHAVTRIWRVLRTPGLPWMFRTPSTSRRRSAKTRRLLEVPVGAVPALMCRSEPPVAMVTTPRFSWVSVQLRPMKFRRAPRIVMGAVSGMRLPRKAPPPPLPLSPPLFS